MTVRESCDHYKQNQIEQSMAHYPKIPTFHANVANSV